MNDQSSYTIFGIGRHFFVQRKTTCCQKSEVEIIDIKFDITLYVSARIDD